MKNIFWIAFVSVILFGCIKDTNSTEQCNYADSQIHAPDSEVQKLATYLDSNHIHAQKDSSGFYYIIHSQGAGAFVTNLCSVVTISYQGRFTNNTIFDSTATNNTASFELGGVILGLQKGIPLVSKGGSITFYIPPSLGYGPNDNNQGRVIIPGNSILIFDVKVLGISG